MKIKAGLNIGEYAYRHDIRFVRKDKGPWWMRALCKIMGKTFRERFWTTIGKTMYYPTNVEPETAVLGLECSVARATFNMRLKNEGWRHVIEHELYHVEQYRRFWHFYSLLYLLVPLPILFAYFRWRFERVAYLHQIKHYGRSVEVTVDLLWRVYGWCWPKPLMRRWFNKELRK